MSHSPPPSHTPLASLCSASTTVEQQKFLQELRAETQNQNPFVSVVPNCCSLLNQEILRVNTLLGSGSALDQSARELVDPLASRGTYSNERANMNLRASPCQSDILGMMQPSCTQNFHRSQSSSSGHKVKSTVRVDIPVDLFPNFNFVSYLHGQTGSTFKQIEASTSRVFIQGRGSRKDPVEEEMLRGKPGYEHLNESLHILIAAELPSEIVIDRLIQAHGMLPGCVSI